MGYKVSITYTAANDIFNAPAQGAAVVSPVSIPALTRQPAPANAYVYAPDCSTEPVHNQDAFMECNCEDGTIEKVEGSFKKGIVYFPGSQRRWPKAVTDAIMKVLEAYSIPQIPVYKAWQTFKLAIDGEKQEFVVGTFAESEFYREAGIALTKYGITVETDKED